MITAITGRTLAQLPVNENPCMKPPSPAGASAELQAHSPGECFSAIAISFPGSSAISHLASVAFHVFR
jgi:hypothetical protein